MTIQRKMQPHIFLLFLGFTWTCNQAMKATSMDLNAKYQSADTPSGFVEIGGEEYYLSPNDTLVNALNASLSCEAMNMTLINLETKRKFELVSDYLHYNDLGNTYFWTAGRMLVTRWMWAGIGQLITYFKWIAGQPDYPDICFCLLIKGSLGLDDTYCDIVLVGYICEHPKC